jgi:type I restriction-modification system DNA methylase subunit
MPQSHSGGGGNNKSFATQQSLNGAIKSICDIMRRSNCAGALQYVPELTWILFLRILDEREMREAEEAEAVGMEYTPSLASPYRWRDWAAPYDGLLFGQVDGELPTGWKRRELQYGALGTFFGFVNGELIPHLKTLRERPNATPRQKVISEIFSGVELETLRRRTFYGREKDNAIYPIALANLVLHNIDEPHIWHGNTLTGGENYGGLFTDAPALYDVVLMNPPFGGKEGKDAQTRFAYKTSATQVLFLQHVINSLKPGGRCGIVLDEGVLFRTNETAFVQTKRKLLDDCDLWCIVSLPPGTFVNAGAGVKTNLLFFTKGEQTARIWYYDLSTIKVGKRNPLTLAHFEEFFRLLPERVDSEHSWTVLRPEIEAKTYDLKAVDPHAKNDADTRTPKELLDVIETKGREVAQALEALRVGRRSV